MKLPARQLLAWHDPIRHPGRQAPERSGKPNPSTGWVGKNQAQFLYRVTPAAISKPQSLVHDTPITSNHTQYQHIILQCLFGRRARGSSARLPSWLVRTGYQLCYVSHSLFFFFSFPVPPTSPVPLLPRPKTNSHNSEAQSPLILVSSIKESPSPPVPTYPRMVWQSR